MATLLRPGVATPARTGWSPGSGRKQLYFPCGRYSVATHDTSRSRFCPSGKGRRRHYSSAPNSGTKFMTKDPEPVVINCAGCGDLHSSAIPCNASRRRIRLQATDAVEFALWKLMNDCHPRS
jgi:hypothetical protein